MSKTPEYDQKIKAILDALKPGDEQICPLSGKTWVLDEKEIKTYRKYNVPPSKIEPETRMSYLTGFAAGFSPWWKKDIDGDVILSSVHPDSPIQIQKDIDWDNADFKDKTLDYDHSRSFFDQLWDLRLIVPEKASKSTACTNCVAIAAYKSVDSYMACGSMTTHCHYCYTMVNGEDSIDVASGEESIRSFYVTGSKKIVDCEFVFESSDCMNSSFLFDCHNCEFCFGATNKHHKKFLWFNQQLNEQDWKERRAKVDLGCRSSIEEHKEKFYDLMKTDAIWPETFAHGNEDSTGDHLFGCVRCQDCYWQMRCTDLYRCWFGLENRGCSYCLAPAWAQNCYFCSGSTQSSNNQFCMGGTKMMNCEYCSVCIDCENCFGCFGLKRAQFCIFNKQYSEDEYWQTVDQIKCKMLDDGICGEFLPAKFSPVGFGHSIGQVYFGYSDQDLKQMGGVKYDINKGTVLAPKQIKGNRASMSELPDCIDDIDQEKFVNVPIHDESLGRDYSVIKSEFEVYKKKRWPFPRRHFISRLTDLIRHSNSPHKESRQCSSCQVDIVTYKNLKFPERKVYCRECYLKYLEQYG